jgi:hypothetical protein
MHSTKSRKRKKSFRLPWQHGKYNRRLNLNILLPYQLLLLCKLWDTAPEDLITDFLDNLSHSSWKREGRDFAKQKLVEYALLSGYGKEFYTEDEILQIFKELDAIGILFPASAGDAVLTKYVAFRDAYQDHWFGKWYYKKRRKDDPVIPGNLLP